MILPIETIIEVNKEIVMLGSIVVINIVVWGISLGIVVGLCRWLKDVFKND